MEQYVLGVAAAWKQIAALRRETDLLDHHHHVQPQELTIRQAQGWWAPQARRHRGRCARAPARPVPPVRPNRNQEREPQP